MSSEELEEDMESIDVPVGFANKRLQRIFAAKMYVIVASQIVIIVLIVVGLTSNEETLEWAETHPQFAILAATVFGVLGGGITFSEHLRRRRNPHYRIIFLLFMTMCLGLVVTITAAVPALDSVYVSLSSAFAVAIVMSIVVRCSSLNVTGCKIYYALFFIAVLAMGISSSIGIFMNMETLHIVYSYVSVILFSTYMLCTIQLIVKEKLGDIKGPGDYILAVLVLYTIVMELCIALFLALYRCCRRCRNRSSSIQGS
ncbi:uncharacterized protein LOC106665304 [Cimex lectularius]|uniref:Uncharacterized protein n=1 Tax=Cimex lectularius TaxID=79782 RepID=A0A8I6RKI4_CIMLE|nr:uncharacterized protein LOC106665304 [Cimex lectularius]